MRALLRRAVDRVLGCTPEQVAARRDLYGWPDPRNNDNTNDREKES